MRTLTCSVLLLAFAASTSSAEEVNKNDPSTDFEARIRPILKAHCFQCHGEEGKREGGLDLRLRRLIAKGGESGPALRPGRPAESLIVKRIQSGEMPPGDDKQLSPNQIRLIARWIERGAKSGKEPDNIQDGPLWTKAEKSFWAFQPVRRPTPPSVKHTSRVNSPMDAFLLHRLERKGFRFAEAADKRVLIRRLYFDLLGLPPAPADVERFIADSSVDAYERLVDRLLASPRYGERWGRHWLDVAGYADSEGYTDADPVRAFAFRYRDYVIRSFNAGKAYNVFLREQLAGDEMVSPPYKDLSPQAVERLTATGFLRMAPDGTVSSGIDQKLARNQNVADTIHIVSTAILGLTVQCAQCHNHRYDPITHEDYYRLRAIFEPALDWKNWRTPAARQISLATQADRDRAKKIQAEAAKVDAERSRKARFYVDRTLDEELLTVAEPLRQPLRTAYKTAAKDRTAKQRQLLDDHPSVKNISPGSLYLYDRRREARARKLQQALPAKRKRLVAAARKRALGNLPSAEHDAARVALKTSAGKRTMAQRRLLAAHPDLLVTTATLAKVDPAAADEIKRDLATIKRLRAEKAADNLKQYSERAATIRARLAPPAFIRALTEIPGKVPTTYLFLRGDHQQPKQKVEPGELAILNISRSFRIPANEAKIPTTGRRLAYARHLTSGRHPLTARVLVNRVWANHFGRGLVATPGDLGYLGERPTHPRLLDWLADEFIRSGWKIKRLHKLIVTSMAYRQSSVRRPDLDRVDPDNLLYGRMNIRRLESEVVRDSILSVSGQISGNMFGDAVPVMEDEVGQIVIGKENLDGERKPTKTIDLGEQPYRRSVYVQVRRSRPLAVLESFDTPSTAPNCTRRSESNVAPQALMMLNSRFVIGHSEQFARRLIRQAGKRRDLQIRQAWLLVYGRAPRADESQAAQRYLEQQESQFAKSNRPAGSRSTVMALASLCQALLASNEFLYVD